jgi:sulfatase maturation enzyme AslB (radical SAM superfamily)
MDLCFGNVFDEGLNTVYQRGRGKMTELFSVEKSEKCISCRYRYFCGGGCRATAENISECDGLCEVIRQRFVDFLERLSLPIIRTRLNNSENMSQKGVSCIKC